MWKYLELPYYRCTTNWQVFCQGEQARVLFSSLQNYPGLFASCNVPFTYLSASGIQPLAFEQIQSNAWVTPYATFPVLLANQTIGLVWLICLTDPVAKGHLEPQSLSHGPMEL